MQDPIDFKKNRDFGQIINDTFSFMRQNFKPLIKIYFMFCGLFVLAGLLSMLVQQYKTVNLVNNLGVGQTKKDLGFGALYGIEYWLTILFSMASYSSMTVAILSYVALYVQNGNKVPSTDQVWSYFKYYFFRVFGSSILLTLLLVLAFICCLLPGFYLFPFIAIMFPIMVLENASLSYSFTRSFALVKNNFWNSFGILIVVWIIIYACMSLVILPTTLFSMVGMFAAKGPHMNLTLTMISTVLQSLCQVFTIIPIITVSLLYYTLVEAKENTGLLERISNFGVTEKPIDNRPEEY